MTKVKAVKRAAVVGVAVLALSLTGCGPSYEEKIEECRSAMAAHDFDAAPLSEGERLPACEGIEGDDYRALVMESSLDRLGWLNDEGRFDRGKMLDSLS